MLIGNSSNSQTPTPPPAARPVTSYNLNIIHVPLQAEFNMNDVITSVFSFLRRRRSALITSVCGTLRTARHLELRAPSVKVNVG